MGADLYLDSLHEPQCGRYAPLVEKWVRKRDRAQTATQREEAQRQVARYYDKMYERGYFRDSYNASSLLWLFDLSWWADISALIEEGDSTSTLSPANAKRLLRRLHRREPVFWRKLQAVELVDGETRLDVASYFQDKYARFQAFLQEAIDRHEPIRVSI